MNIITSVFQVFTEVAEWFADVMPIIQGMFWNTETGLTFLGLLAIAGLGVSIVFLLLGVISSFLHFRG